MKRIRYLLRVLHGASIQKLTKIISRIHEQTGKSCVLLFADILICAVKYGAGYNDYLIFAFYEMTPKQRKTYVTRFINKRMISLLNKPSHECLFDRKTLFNDRFAAYLGRESFNVQHFGASEFLRFAQGKDAVFAKPDIGQCGKESSVFIFLRMTGRPICIG
jgi:hypothetical protein